MKCATVHESNVLGVTVNGGVAHVSTKVNGSDVISIIFFGKPPVRVIFYQI